MTYVSTHFNDFATKIEKCFTLEIHTFDGEVYQTEEYAYTADEARAQADNGNVDYIVVLFCEIA